MGFERTRIAATHFPSPRNAGKIVGATSSGRAGNVVVVVVVVVVSPGSVTGTVVVVVVVVVVVDVVVVARGSIVVVVVVVGVGLLPVLHETARAGRAFGFVTAGGADSMVVRVVCWDGCGAGACDDGTVVSTPVVGGDTGVVSGTVSVARSSTARANVSAGAAEGGSSCSQTSSWSTMRPMPFSRAHEAMFCCNGSFGWASTYRVTDTAVSSTISAIAPARMRSTSRRDI